MDSWTQRRLILLVTCERESGHDYVLAQRSLLALVDHGRGGFVPSGCSTDDKRRAVGDVETRADPEAPGNEAAIASLPFRVEVSVNISAGPRAVATSRWVRLSRHAAELRGEIEDSASARPQVLKPRQDDTSQGDWLRDVLDEYERAGAKEGPLSVVWFFDGHLLPTEEPSGLSLFGALRRATCVPDARVTCVQCCGSDASRESLQLRLWARCLDIRLASPASHPEAWFQPWVVWRGSLVIPKSELALGVGPLEGVPVDRDAVPRLQDWESGEWKVSEVLRLDDPQSASLPGLLFENVALALQSSGSPSEAEACEAILRAVVPRGLALVVSGGSLGRKALVYSANDRICMQLLRESSDPVWRAVAGAVARRYTEAASRDDEELESLVAAVPVLRPVAHGEGGDGGGDEDETPPACQSEDTRNTYLFSVLERRSAAAFEEAEPPSADAPEEADAARAPLVDGPLAALLRLVEKRRRRRERLDKAGGGDGGVEGGPARKRPRLSRTEELEKEGLSPVSARRVAPFPLSLAEVPFPMPASHRSLSSRFCRDGRPSPEFAFRADPVCLDPERPQGHFLFAYPARGGAPESWKSVAERGRLTNCGSNRTIWVPGVDYFVSGSTFVEDEIHRVEKTCLTREAGSLLYDVPRTPLASPRAAAPAPAPRVPAQVGSGPPRASSSAAAAAAGENETHSAAGGSTSSAPDERAVCGAMGLSQDAASLQCRASPRRRIARESRGLVSSIIDRQVNFKSATSSAEATAAQLKENKRVLSRVVYRELLKYVPKSSPRFVEVHSKVYKVLVVLVPASHPLEGPVPLSVFEDLARREVLPVLQRLLPLQELLMTMPSSAAPLHLRTRTPTTDGGSVTRTPTRPEVILAAARSQTPVELQLGGAVSQFVAAGNSKHSPWVTATPEGRKTEHLNGQPPPVVVRPQDPGRPTARPFSRADHFFAPVRGSSGV